MPAEDQAAVGQAYPIKRLRTSMAQMDERLSIRETSLRTQFAAMEAALSQSQSQSAWLAGQLAALQQ